MGWPEVRSAIDAAIEAFERLAAEASGHSRDSDQLGSRISVALGGSSHELPRKALDHTASAADRASEAAMAYRYAAQLCKDYLAAVDPAGAAGSVTGLKPPVAVGAAKGGHGPTGSPPARVSLTDVSRDRGYVFPEQGPNGLADLVTRDDGIIALRSQWMDAGGHARLRHGGGVTDQQLKDRAMYGKDPVNGSTTDWETGRPHTAVRNATAFTADADLVFAEAHAWNSKAGRDARKAAESGGVPFFKVESRASEVFGPRFRDHVRGQTRVGSASNPQDAAPTSFGDDTTIRTLYTRADAQTPWVAYTCYPVA